MQFKSSLRKTPVFLLASLVFTAAATAQVGSLEGTWNIEPTSEGVEYSPVTVDNQGNASFSETYTYTAGATESIFDVEHTGKFTYVNQEFVYLGIGVGVARDSNGGVQVRFEVAAYGIGSDDNNMLVGVWVSQETYTTPEGQFLDEEECTLIMTREGYDPGTPGQAVAGVWEVHLTGENIDWTGEVTLDPEGTMTGELAAQSGLPVPVAGLFSYSEAKAFDFTYSTTTELPVVGEATVTVSGQGQGNGDNSQISGTWLISVEVSTLVTKTFAGTFELTKVAESSVAEWCLLDG